MKRARRVILITLAFLLIGAAVNVGVAWVCVGQADLDQASWTFPPGASWPRPVPVWWPVEVSAAAQHGKGWRVEHFSGRRWFADEDRLHTSTISLYSAGWPLRALSWESWNVSPGCEMMRDGWRAGHPRSPWVLGVAYPHRDRSDWWKRLPISPVWPGFAINTMLYAALAAGLWYAPGALQRVRRRCRGRCLTCGYPRTGLAEDAVCPECGGDGGVAKP